MGSTDVLGRADAEVAGVVEGWADAEADALGLALGLARQPATTSASSAGAAARRGSGTRLAAQLGQAMLDGEGGRLRT